MGEGAGGREARGRASWPRRASFLQPAPETWGFSTLAGPRFPSVQIRGSEQTVAEPLPAACRPGRPGGPGGLDAGSLFGGPEELQAHPPLPTRKPLTPPRGGLKGVT